MVWKWNKNKEEKLGTSVKEKRAKALRESGFNLLLKCKAVAAPVIVVGFDAEAVCRGRFTAVLSDTLMLELIDLGNEKGFTSPYREIFRQMSACAVSFFVGARGGVFLASVIDYIHEPGAPYPILVLEKPKDLTVTETRKNFRVPIVAESGLAVKIITEAGNICDAKAIDISFGGILLAISEKQNHGLKTGIEVQLRLELEGQEVYVRAEVRRAQKEAEKNTYGLFFPGSIVDGRVEPSDELSILVGKLERIWVRTRRTLIGSS